MLVPSCGAIDLGVRRLVQEGSGLTGETVIAANQDGPSPSSLYATVLPMMRRLDGLPIVRPSDGIAQAFYLADYSVQWIQRGAGSLTADDAALRFRLWLMAEAGRQAAARSSLTIVDAGEARVLDAIVSSEWEKRTGIDVTIGYAQYDDGLAIADAVVRADGALISQETAEGGPIYDLRIEV